MPQIPANFADFLLSFKPKIIINFEPLYELFDKKTIEEENNSIIGETKSRQEIDYPTMKPNRRYMRGIDFYGNKFPDHQI